MEDSVLSIQNTMPVSYISSRQPLTYSTSEYRGIFARQDLNIITQLHLHVDQQLIAENEIIIEKNQASQLQRSRIKKIFALRRITRKALYPFNCLSLQPLEASRARLSKGGGM